MAWSSPPPAALQQSLHALYSDHHGWLRVWLQRKLGCPFDAADLTHDTYARLIGSRRFPPPGESRGWLVQIAKGLLIDLRRRRRVETAYRRALAILTEQQQAPGAEEREIALETLVSITAILDRLSPKAREAFLLSRLDRLTYPQIAARLNVSVASVQKYMLTAVKACYSALQTPHVATE
jgi:RNA polymerase sigma-70 factor (ECF subfamily)